MDIRIVKASADQPIPLNLAESRFLVESELTLNLSGGRLGYEVVAVAPYEKVCPPSETVGASTAPGASFLALSGDRIVGRIVLCRNWNEFACVKNQLDLHRCSAGRRVAPHPNPLPQAGEGA